MLNLKIAMLNFLAVKPLVMLFLTLFSELTITPGLYITSPVSSEVVEGVIEIRGSVPEEEFASAEVLYSYAQTDKDTWFLIKRLDKVVQDDVLATWDTTTITDGVYRIKLTVKTTDGSENAVVIENILVSNYTRVQVQPEGITVIQTANSSAAAEIVVPHSAAAEKRVNPASIQPQEVQRTIIIGILLTCAALGSIALYSSTQSRRRRR